LGASPVAVKVSVGFDYKRLKFGLSGIRFNENNGYTIDVGYNF